MSIKEREPRIYRKRIPYGMQNFSDVILEDCPMLAGSFFLFPRLPPSEQLAKKRQAVTRRLKAKSNLLVIVITYFPTTSFLVLCKARAKSRKQWQNTVPL